MITPVFNKAFVKYLFSVSNIEATINYRYYLIAKLHFYKRSGIFSVDEFLDVLCQHYGYACLHHGKGNSRAKYRRRFWQLFTKSVLFSLLDDGRVKYIPEKKLYSSRMQRFSSSVPFYGDDLLCAKTFTDRVIGVVSSGNSLKSYATIATQTNFTRRRCIEAAKQNDQDERIVKVHNYILVKSDRSKSVINRERERLRTYHGIATPDPVRYNKHWYLCVYAANSYVPVSLPVESANTKRVKAKKKQKNSPSLQLSRGHLTPYINKSRFYLQRVSEKCALLRRHKNTNFYTFKEDLFTYQDYIETYSQSVGAVVHVA